MANRLARVAGSERWQGMGDVTLENAAVNLFQHVNPAGDVLMIEVADSADGPIWRLKVTASKSFRVEGLRGGDV